MNIRVLSKVLRAESNRLSLLSKHFIAALKPFKGKTNPIRCMDIDGSF